MKLTDEQRIAMETALRSVGTSSNPNDHWAACFLAGCAWQREQPAERIFRNDDSGAVTVNWRLADSWIKRGHAVSERKDAAIRAQGDDRE